MVTVHGNMFNLSQIAHSGQCFRLMQINDQEYISITANHFVHIVYVPENNTYMFECTEEEFMLVWKEFFDLNTDYGAFQNVMQKDTFLTSALHNGYDGIRILKQDLWETLITFIISQQNNIPRIRRTVAILCENYGTLLGYHHLIPIYAFPTKEQLKGKDLSIAHLGYREQYIQNVINYPDEFFTSLTTMDDADAYKTLMDIKGVGKKVANCTMLFALHRLRCYPKDVWVNRLIDDIYDGDFDITPYQEFAGYVQQIQFDYYRKLHKNDRREIK